MADPEITTVIAPNFSWTPDATFDIRLAFPTGASPAQTTVIAGTYRINLARTTGTVKDFLRALESAINVAITGMVTRTETVAVTISARGRVTLTLSTGVCTWTLTSALAALLGFAATTYASVGSITAAHAPRWLFLLLGGDSGSWQEETEVAATAMTDGTVLGLASSGIKRWRDTIELEFIPKNPTLAANGDQAADWSAWEPDAGGGTGVPWTLAELRRAASGQECAFTRDWASVRTSTSTSYDLVYIDPESLRKPQARQQFASYAVWVAWSITLIATCDTTNTWLRAYGTRA